MRVALALALASAIALLGAAADEGEGETDRSRRGSPALASSGSLRQPACLRAPPHSAAGAPPPPPSPADRALLSCANGMKDGLETGTDCECAAAAPAERATQCPGRGGMGSAGCGAAPWRACRCRACPHNPAASSLLQVADLHPTAQPAGPERRALADDKRPPSAALFCLHIRSMQRS